MQPEQLARLIQCECGELRQELDEGRLVGLPQRGDHLLSERAAEVALQQRLRQLLFALSLATFLTASLAFGDELLRQSGLPGDLVYHGMPPQSFQELSVRQRQVRERHQQCGQLAPLQIWQGCGRDARGNSHRVFDRRIAL